MAITKGLFGYDPYEIQMQQQQRLMQPITQATNPYERIGAGLGTLLGASLFDIQDPRLARAAKLGTITKQIMGENADPTATDFVPKLEKLAETLLAEGEVDAAAYAMEQAKKFAPKREIKTVGNQVVDFSGAEPKVLFTGTDKESIVKTPADFALTGQSLGIAPKANAADYTSEETQRIQAKILEDKKAQARASATTINTADPGWQVKAVGEVNSQTKENDTQLTYISQALNTTLNGRTPFGQKAFETLVGNVFGGKVKAQAEIERLRNSGTLGQRLDNTLTLFLQGKIEQASRDDQAEVLLSLYELSGKQRDVIVDQYRGILGPDSAKVTRTTAERHPLPKLTGNREYIPMSIVNQYNLSKGQKVKQGNKEFVYNGDGTITVLKKGE
jgi:hypothetical protein